MNTKTTVSTLAGMACVAALTLGASSAARAQDDIFWSIGMSSPGVRVGVSNAPAVVMQPPIYVQPAPVYMPPRVVYMPPQPVYYGYGYGYRNYREHEGYRGYGYRGGERGEYRGGERFEHERGGGRPEGRGDGRSAGRGDARGGGEFVRGR